MDILYSELQFWVIFFGEFFLKFLSNNYRYNKSSYRIIIMNKMMEYYKKDFGRCWVLIISALRNTLQVWQVNSVHW